MNNLQGQGFERTPPSCRHERCLVSWQKGYGNDCLYFTASDLAPPPGHPMRKPDPIPLPDAPDWNPHSGHGAGGPPVQQGIDMEALHGKEPMDNIDYGEANLVAEELHAFHEGNADFSVIDLRVFGERLVNWANKVMGEHGSTVPDVRDPWGNKVDTRGM